MKLYIRDKQMTSEGIKLSIQEMHVKISNNNKRLSQLSTEVSEENKKLLVKIKKLTALDNMIKECNDEEFLLESLKVLGELRK